MPKMYDCTKCGKRHRSGKIYQEHLEFKKIESDIHRSILLKKLAKLNRKIAFGDYTNKDVLFLKQIKLKLEAKIGE